MAANGARTKRKPDLEADEHVEQDERDARPYDLELLSDDENDALTDDGEVDEFPEIDTRSDSGDDEEEVEDEGEDDGSSEGDDGDEEDEEDEEDEDDSDLQIFPKAKTIISEITGQQKRVFPPIEPDYDSDSSTEDVGC